MISPEAIRQFAEQQRGLIHSSYDKAWAQGVEGYEPDADPEEPSPEHQHRGEEASLTGLLLLKARANRVYQPPEAPDPTRRQQALAGALASTERMAGELAQLSPTPEHFAEAQTEVDDGKIAVEALMMAALGAAVAEWAESNAYRLDSGASVAWAGEQAGYAEAANTDGKLLVWDDQGDDRECEDCLGLAALGPLPLEDFPTTPGAGDTECSAGCRCALEAVDVEALPGDELRLLGEEETTVLDKVAGQAQERMDRLAPNFSMTG